MKTIRPSSNEKVTNNKASATRTRLLGIHGARGTGKTCYLACLYGCRATEHAAVVFRDNDTINHLEAIWSTLVQGDLPPATALTLPTEIRMELNTAGLSWNLNTQDYAGALVQRSETGVPELKEGVREWLKSCHAILLFIGIDADERSLRERHNELDLLITELKKLSLDGNTIARPLALLLTKWDIHGPPSHDLAQERERAWEFLGTNSSFKQIAESLRKCGDRVEIFPVSSFGSHQEGNRPPLGGPHPVGHIEPLVWIAQKTDEMLLEKTRRDAQQLAGPQLWWWQRRYAAAVDCYRNLINKDGINKGPLYETARKELQHWRFQHLKQRLHQLLVSTIAFGSITYAGLRWEDTPPYEAAKNALQDPSILPDEVRQVCENYLRHWNPYGHWTGRRQEIASRWQTYQEIKEEEDFWALKKFRTEDSHDKDADKRAQRGREFLERWPNSRYAPVVQSWIRDDEERYRRYVHDIDYNNLVKFREEHPSDEDAQRCAQAAKEFLNKWPNSHHASTVQNWIREDEKRFEQYNHEREYKELKEYWAKHTKPDQAKECAEEGERFLKKWPDSPHRSDIQTKAQEYQETYKKYLTSKKLESDYHRLISDLGKMNDNYDRMIALCHDFLSQYSKKYILDEYIHFIDDVEKKIDAYTKAKDDKDWAEVVNYDRQNPNNFDEIIKRAKEYVNRPNARYRQEAIRMIEDVEVRWDRVEYNKVRDAVENAKDPNSLWVAQRAALRYRDGSHPLKTMKSEVQKWLDWFEGLKQEKEYYITVKSLSIPSGSSLEDSFTTEETRVYISLNGKEYVTNWRKGKNPQFEEELGPFQYRWGQQATLEVKVEEYDNIFSNAWAKGSVSDASFVLLKAHGTFTVTCSAGKDVPVYLECPAVVAPSLPPYKAK
jgi:outer membrane protein assembly factor BamD (BamD/ComL family)